MKFFRSEMTPPPFGNFPKIHPFWNRQASRSSIPTLWSLVVEEAVSLELYMVQRGVTDIIYHIYFVFVLHMMIIIIDSYDDHHISIKHKA